MTLNLDGLNKDGLLFDEEERTAPLRSTMEQSVKENPDSRAKIMDLSDKSGVAPKVVETNPEEFEIDQRLKGLNLDGIVTSSPGTAKYLEDFNNASVSHDDVPLMQRLESIGKKVAPFVLTPYTIKEAVDFSEETYDDGKPFDNLTKTIPMRFRNMMEGNELRRIESVNALTKTDPYKPSTAQDPYVRDLINRQNQSEVSRIDEILLNATERERQISDLTPEGLNTVQQGLRAGIESLPPVLAGLGLGAVTRTGTAGVLSTIGVNTFGDSYASARAEGLEPQEASMYAGLQAGIEVGTELIPVKTLVTIMNTPGSSQTARNVVRFMVQEMGTEQIATLGQTIVDYGYELDEQLAAATSPTEMLEIQAQRQAVTAVATIVGGGVQSGIATTANKVATGMMSEEQRQQAAQETEQMQIDELAKTVDESKTKKRSPAMFKRFMQQAVNADQKDVIIDAVQAKLYLNSLDPKVIEEDAGLNLLYGKLVNNESPDGDVEITLADFAADFVGSEHFEALRPHMKLSHDTETQFRQEAASEQQANYLKDLMSKAEEQGSIYVENKRLFDTVKQELVDTGQVPQKLANYYAQLIPAWVTVKSEETGIAPLDLYAQMGLKIQGPYTERQQALDEGRVLEQAQAEGFEGTDVVEAGAWVRGVQAGLDMSPEGRTQRAQEMGYDTSQVLYHGTGLDLDNLSPDAGQGFSSNTGVFLSSSANVAGSYTGGTNPNTMPVYIKPDNQLRVHTGGRFWSAIDEDAYIINQDGTSENLYDALDLSRGENTNTNKIAQRAREMGYSSLVMTDVVDVGGFMTNMPDSSSLSEPADIYVVFDEAAIRSTNAAFNPDNADSNNVLEQSLVGAPTEVNIPGVGNVEFGIHEPAVEIAKQYAQDSGIDYVKIEAYAPVDLERAADIAEAFDAMEHNPQDPDVKASYAAMIKETLDQFEAIMAATNMELHWYPEGQDPYGNSPREMILDVIDNNRMYIFSTRAGFGSNEKVDVSDNPLLAETDYKVDGQTMLVNDVFRMVHDYFGHVKHGVGFRAGGEENAWQAHASMYTPLARRAMTTETRGQNSWVNYGPHGEHNRTALAEDTIFADQKIGLLPIWASESGRLSDYERQARFDRARTQGTTGFEGAIDEQGRVELVHYSRQPIEATDPGRWGQGLSGRVITERNRMVGVDAAPGRTYFGIESAVEGAYGKEVGLGDFRTIAKVPGHLVYDVAADPHNFRSRDVSKMERAIKEAGYMGYWYQDRSFGKIVALFDGVRVESQQVYNQDLSYNDLGLYSAVEKAFSDLNIQGWDGKSKVEWTDENEAELESLTTGRLLEEGSDDYKRAQALNELKRKSIGVANGKELWAKISKTAGIKKEELEWMGLEDFLTLEPKARFTRDEVLRFIRNNGVEVTETVADGDTNTIEDFSFDWSSEIDDDSGNWEHRTEDFMSDVERDDFDWMNDQDQWFDTWFLENSNAYFEDIEKKFDNGVYDEEQYTAARDLMQQWLDVGNDTETVLSVIEEIESESGFTPSQLQALVNDLQEEADEQARIEYLEDPVQVFTDSDYNIELAGSGDLGWSLSRQGEFVDSFDSFWDAEQYAKEQLYENGELSSSSDENTPRWAEYNTDQSPYDNYREIKLKFEPTDGTFTFESHFEEEENILAFLRVDDRDLAAELPGDVDESTLPPVYEPQLIDETDPRVQGDTLPDDLWYGTVNKQWKDVVVGDDNNADVTPSRYRQLTDVWNQWDIENRVSIWNQLEEQQADRSAAKRNDAMPESEKANTYFIDEFQSDWHQQGRQKGYRRALTIEDQTTIEELNLQIDKLQQDRMNTSMAALESIGDVIKEPIPQNGNEPTIININVEGVAPIRLFSMKLGDEMTGWGAAIQTQENIEQDGEMDTDVPFEQLVPITSEWTTFKRQLEKNIKSTVRGMYQEELVRLTDRRQAITQIASSSIPDAPFKGDAWINLGLKRAIVDAVNNGYDALSWVDSNVLADRWSESYRDLYVNQYDRKMVKLVKKLTGASPQHLTFNGDAHQHQELGYWTIPITKELREKVQSEGFTLFQNQSRGYYDPENVTIRLTEASDASTFLHEFAHFMLDMERRTDGKQMQPIKDWWMRNAAEVAEEAGVEQSKVESWIQAGPQAGLTAQEFEAIDRATHEQFARGFETYVMEGKAPSIELRNAFRVFARLIKSVYDAVTGGLNKPKLDDEMRAVFDRLLATDEQVAAEEARSRYEPLFTDAVMAGMTEEQYQRYLERNRQASDKSKETVRTKLLNELRRNTESWWKRERGDRIAERITALQNTPVYAAREKLGNADDFKLDRAAVKELMGIEKIPPVLRGMTITGKRGASPDDAAAFLGFNSGQEMLTELMNAPKIQDLAAEQAEADMIAEHGDLMNDGSLEQLAQEASRNEERASIILSEIKQLSKTTGAPTIDKKTLKFLADREVGKKSLQGLRPDKYRRAEIRSAQEAAVAMKEGNVDEAMRAKTKQVMNMYLWKAAMEAREQGDRVTKYMARFRKKTVRERIGKAGNGYLDQIMSILNRFEFRKSISVKKAQENAQSIQAWYTARAEDGDNIVLSMEVMDEKYGRHWKELPIDELTGIYESVLSIEHNARSANRITLAEEEMSFEQAINRALASMSRVKNKFNAQRTDIIDEKNPVRRFIAEQTKVPFLTSWLDGGERVGVMTDLIMTPMNNAHYQQQTMWAEVGMPVVKALQSRSKEMRKRHAKKIYIPEIKSAPTDMHTGNDGNLYGHQVLAVALNTGNDGNLTKMLVGEGWATEDDITLDNPQLQAVLKHMTKEDWDMVQLIWDQIGKLYPDLAAVHQRTSGLPLESVEAVPVETPFGTYAGGYYPVKYDPNRSQRAAENEEKANEQTLSMFNSAGLVLPSVTTGARVARTEYVGPIKLSLEVVQEHMHEVIHFISHYEAVKQVYKVIRDPQIAEAITAKMGKSEYNILKPWLNDVAKDGRSSESKLQMESWLGRLRTGVTLGVMGFKASTILIQGSGIFNTMSETGGKDVLNAMRTILFSDKSMSESYEFAFENSKVLKFRMQTMDRELRNVLGSVEGKAGWWSKAQEVSMMGIALFQTYTVDVTSWYAGYMKGMRDFEGDQTRAMKYADWVVENAQGSGATKDMAAIMRNKNEAWRLFTMFMTFFSSLGNMVRDTTRGAASGQYSITTTAAKAMFMFMLPAIYEAVMREGIPDDEEEAEELVDRVVFNAVMMPLGTQPVVRDIANGVASGFGYNASPVFATVGKGVEATGTMATRWMDEEEITKSQIKNFSRMVGAWVKLPGVNQAWASGEHIYEVLEDGEDFSTRELLFGPDWE